MFTALLLLLQLTAADANHAERVPNPPPPTPTSYTAESVSFLIVDERMNVLSTGRYADREPPLALADLELGRFPDLTMTSPGKTSDLSMGYFCTQYNPMYACWWEDYALLVNSADFGSYLIYFGPRRDDPASEVMMLVDDPQGYDPQLDEDLGGATTDVWVWIYVGIDTAVPRWMRWFHRLEPSDNPVCGTIRLESSFGVEQREWRPESSDTGSILLRIGPSEGSSGLPTRGGLTFTLPSLPAGPVTIGLDVPGFDTRDVVVELKEGFRHRRRLLLTPNGEPHCTPLTNSCDHSRPNVGDMVAYRLAHPDVHVMTCASDSADPNFDTIVDVADTVRLKLE